MNGMRHFNGAVTLVAAMVSGIAAPVQFTVDPTQSKIAASGTVAGSAIQEQGPGGLVTSFQGVLNVETNNSGVQFVNGSVLTADSAQSWQPLPGGQPGSAPANYGVQATIVFATAKGAARNIQLTLSSPLLPMANGQFSAGQIVFGFPTNSTAGFDYNAGFLGSGSRSLAGASTNQTATTGTLGVVGGSEVLTVDIDTTFKFKILADNDSSLTLKGKLVASHALAPVFQWISVNTGLVRMAVSGADASYRLQSSSDLAHWSAVNPDVTVDGDQRIYSTPVAGAKQFFRLVK